MAQLKSIKGQMSKTLVLRVEKNVDRFLGMRINKEIDRIQISDSILISSIAYRFFMAEAK